MYCVTTVHSTLYAQQRARQVCSLGAKADAHPRRPRRAAGRAIQVCVSARWDVPRMTKSPKDACLSAIPVFKQHMTKIAISPRPLWEGLWSCFIDKETPRGQCTRWGARPQTPLLPSWQPLVTTHGLTARQTAELFARVDAAPGSRRGQQRRCAEDLSSQPGPFLPRVWSHSQGPGCGVSATSVEC